MNEDNKKIMKAKKEIIGLLYFTCFLLSSFTLQYVIVVNLGIQELQGTGFIWFFYMCIVILWVFVVEHTKKTHKRQIHHNQAKNSRQQHE